MNVIRLGAGDDILCREAAHLHIASIHLGLLPLLGSAFLSKMYLCIAAAPKSGVWVIVDGDKFIGFVAGCASVKRTFEWILIRYGCSLAIAAGMTLFRYSVLKRLYPILLYPFRMQKNIEKTKVVEAELLAIAIQGNEYGKGYGRRLVGEFEAELRKWEVLEYRVLTNIAEVSSNAFYIATDFHPVGTVAHNTLTLQIYHKALSTKTSININAI